MLNKALALQSALQVGTNAFEYQSKLGELQFEFNKFVESCTPGDRARNSFEKAERCIRLYAEACNDPLASLGSNTSSSDMSYWVARSMLEDNEIKELDACRSELEREIMLPRLLARARQRLREKRWSEAALARGSAVEAARLGE